MIIDQLHTQCRQQQDILLT